MIRQTTTTKQHIVVSIRCESLLLFGVVDVVRCSPTSSAVCGICCAVGTVGTDDKSWFSTNLWTKALQLIGLVIIEEALVHHLCWMKCVEKFEQICRDLVKARA